MNNENVDNPSEGKSQNSKKPSHPFDGIEMPDMYLSLAENRELNFIMDMFNQPPVDFQELHNAKMVKKLSKNKFFKK
jgi:hypothetical protein